MVLLPGLVRSASLVAFWGTRLREDHFIERVRGTESGLVLRSNAEVIRKLLVVTFIGYYLIRENLPLDGINFVFLFTY